MATVSPEQPNSANEVLESNNHPSVERAEETVEAVLEQAQRGAVNAVELNSTRASAYTAAMNRLGETLPPRTAAAIHELMATQLQPAASQFDQLMQTLRLDPNVVMQETQNMPPAPEARVIPVEAVAPEQRPDFDIKRPESDINEIVHAANAAYEKNNQVQAANSANRPAGPTIQLKQ